MRRSVRFSLLFSCGLLGTALGCRARHTVEEQVARYAPAVDARLRPSFERAGVPYPPARLVLVGLKAEKQLQVYAAAPDKPLAFIRGYPILAASGKAGPKLREGDRQVPEGLYGIESLNPNSRFHLSLRIDYPNAFDRRQASAEGRTNLGGDIMIHGGTASIGCLAMGDPAAEDLFVLAAKTGLPNIRVLLCPADPRSAPIRPPADAPPWTGLLYESLTKELSTFPPAAATGHARR